MVATFDLLKKLKLAKLIQWRGFIPCDGDKECFVIVGYKSRSTKIQDKVFKIIKPYIVSDYCEMSDALEAINPNRIVLINKGAAILSVLHMESYNCRLFVVNNTMSPHMVFKLLKFSWPMVHNITASEYDRALMPDVSRTLLDKLIIEDLLESERKLSDPDECYGAFVENLHDGIYREALTKRVFDPMGDQDVQEQVKDLIMQLRELVHKL